MSILSFFNGKNTINRLLAELQGPSEKKRFKALEELSKMELRLDEGLKLLEASKNEFPKSEDEWEDISAQLIEICANMPYFEYVGKIEKIYDELNPQAKIAALQFLASYENEQALISYLKLLAKDYKELQALPTGSLNSYPRFSNILFPGLLKYTDNQCISRDIYLLLLTYLEFELISEAALGEYRSAVIRDIVNMSETVLEYWEEEQPSSIWDNEEYMIMRSYAGVHFDLAGYMKDAKVTMALRNLMHVKDIRLKMFAAISLLKHGQTVEPKDALEIAADSEVRNWFYDRLCEVGKSELYPEKYRTQEAFAESNMIDWLIYPTELGRVPDEIELAKVFDCGDEEYYLFKFRCSSDDFWTGKGWMAGISGPFDKKSKPTTSAQGHTFSHFKKWDEMSPDDHFKTIVENLKEYWIKRAEELEQ
ncbi:MAG: hypothetical protein N2645_04550 [Clostridia bacterium]|nr:hypothetical protein [Clostridia bacterium]